MEMGFSTLLDNRVEYGTVLYRLSMVVVNGVESGAGRGGDREPATTGLLATPNSRGSSPGVVWFPPSRTFGKSLPQACGSCSVAHLMQLTHINR